MIEHGDEALEKILDFVGSLYYSDILAETTNINGGGVGIAFQDTTRPRLYEKANEDGTFTIICMIENPSEIALIRDIERFCNSPEDVQELCTYWLKLPNKFKKFRFLCLNKYVSQGDLYIESKSENKIEIQISFVLRPDKWGDMPEDIEEIDPNEIDWWEFT